MARSKKFPTGPRMTLAKNRIATAKALAAEQDKGFRETLNEISALLNDGTTYEDALEELGAEVDYEVPSLVTGVAGGFDRS